MSTVGRASGRGLIRRLPVGRGYLPALVVLALASGGATIAYAELLAAAIAGPEVAPLPWLLVAVLARALLAVLARAISGEVSARARWLLRNRLLAGTAAGPRGRGAAGSTGAARAGEDGAGARVSLLTWGLDALDPYLSGYLPQLAGALVIPPLLLCWMAVSDLPSALIVLVTLPLVPLFGALVGRHTAAATRRRLRLLDRLGGHFLDALAGLATLRSFGRDRHQVGEVRRMAEAHRRATMSVLRIAFLSALVLELVAALSVALVAVPLGTRLLDGTVTLRVALVVLLLAPEIYLPLRAVGSAFHVAADGAGVAERALAEPSPPAGTAASRCLPRVPDAATAPIRLEEVTVTHPGRDAPALDRLSLEFGPGERVALAGPSGAGKSTVLRVLLGLVVPTHGRILVDGVDLAELDMEAWRRQLAWVPQHPHVFGGTIATNITLGADRVDPDRLRRAITAARALDFCADRGLDTVVGAGGAGLSAGQRQRLALARAHYRDAGLVLLDEPTARLDLETEAAVLAATQRLAGRGRAIVVAHRPALLESADRIVWLVSGREASRPRPEGTSRRWHVSA